MPNAMSLNLTEDNLKVMLVGPTGSGKSHCASTAPTPGFILDLGQEVRSYEGKDFDYESFDISSKGWTEMEIILNNLVNQTYTPEDPKNNDRRKPGEGKKYRTFILENTTALAETAMARCMDLVRKYDEVGGPVWNIHYKMAAQLCKGTIRKLISRNDCNRIIICHTKHIKDKEGNVIGAEPLLGGELPTIVPGFFDEILYATTVMSNTPGAAKPIANYRLQTRNMGLYKARSRSSGPERRLPDFIPNQWGYITREIKKTTTQTTKK